MNTTYTYTKNPFQDSWKVSPDVTDKMIKVLVKDSARPILIKYKCTKLIAVNVCAQYRLNMT